MAQQAQSKCSKELLNAIRIAKKQGEFEEFDVGCDNLNRVDIIDSGDTLWIDGIWDYISPIDEYAYAKIDWLFTFKITIINDSVMVEPLVEQGTWRGELMAFGKELNGCSVNPKSKTWKEIRTAVYQYLRQQLGVTIKNPKPTFTYIKEQLK